MMPGMSEPVKVTPESSLLASMNRIARELRPEFRAALRRLDEADGPRPAAARYRERAAGLQAEAAELLARADEIDPPAEKSPGIRESRLFKEAIRHLEAFDPEEAARQLRAKITWYRRHADQYQAQADRLHASAMNNRAMAEALDEVSLPGQSGA